MRTLPLLLAFACQPSTSIDLPEPGTRPVTPVATPPPLVGETMTAVAYNVESGDAEVGTVSAKVAEVTGEVLWGFSEASSQGWLDAFADAAADDASQTFLTVLGSTGNSDRLGIVYDDLALDLIRTEELNNINVGGTARAPLVAEFELRANGTRFLFMVNHLWRSEDASRLRQAELLNDWAGEQTLPLIAMGDYNFDWAVDGGDTDHDAGYDAMVAGGAWNWVRPETLIPTQCGFSQSVLDFAFVGGEARDWPASSEILFPQNVNCVDDEFKSDHRPVQLTILVPDPM